MSKKSSNEKKTVSKSMKLSPDIARFIEDKAKEANMNFSEYMIDCALHRDKALTPEILCKLENIIESCVRLAPQTLTDDVNIIRSEADSLWELLR